jgi:hypothetical protein
MLVSSTNKTDRHDITEILLKVALITIDQPTIKHELDSLNTHQTPFQYLIAISNMLDHKLTTLVVIGTDCTGSCKYIYHTITIMSMAPLIRVSNKYTG